jgi:PAS domain S-box-containing protein
MLQLAQIEEITHIGTWEWDVGAESVRGSSELFRIHGLAPDTGEIAFETFMARVYPVDRQRTRDELTRVLAGGEPARYVERVLREDGELRVLESRVEAVRDGRRRVVRLRGTSQDVTDKRAEEDARCEAELRLRQLVESVQAILWRADATASTFTFVSGEAEALLGYPVSRWLSEVGFWSDHLHPEDREWATTLRARAAQEAKHHELEYRMIAADGRVVWLRDASRVVQPGGNHRELVGMMIDVTESRMASDELRRSREQLLDFSTHLEWVREQERTAIAREVHDELGRALTALKMEIAWLLRRHRDVRAQRPRQDLVERIGRMSLLADQTIDRVRRITHELRPGVLDDLGLPAAIEWQAREFESRSGIRCEVRSGLSDDRLDRDLATGMFRIFQEALANVGRHAEASRVEVALARQGRTLLLTVRDDGKGIPPEGPSRAHSMGLLGMKERARRLGGSLSLSGRAGKGTEVVVTVLLPSPEGPPRSGS